MFENDGSGLEPWPSGASPQQISAALLVKSLLRGFTFYTIGIRVPLCTVYEVC